MYSYISFIEVLDLKYPSISDLLHETCPDDIECKCITAHFQSTVVILEAAWYTRLITSPLTFSF